MDPRGRMLTSRPHGSDPEEKPPGNAEHRSWGWWGKDERSSWGGGVVWQSLREGELDGRTRGQKRWQGRFRLELAGCGEDVFVFLIL